MTEKREIFVKVTVQEDGEIAINSSVSIDACLKLLAEGISLISDNVQAKVIIDEDVDVEEEEVEIITTEG